MAWLQLRYKVPGEQREGEGGYIFSIIWNLKQKKKKQKQNSRGVGLLNSGIEKTDLLL